MNTQPSLVIGIIAPQLSLFYYGELLAGMDATARPRGAHLLAIQGSPQQVAATQLAADHVSGWIVISDITGVERLAAQGKPIVTIGAVAGASIPAVLPDNHGGTQAAVRHLIEHGQRRIAFAGHLADFDTQPRSRRPAWRTILRWCSTCRRTLSPMATAWPRAWAARIANAPPWPAQPTSWRSAHRWRSARPACASLTT